jgi:PAS domain S-box-containing protein
MAPMSRRPHADHARLLSVQQAASRVLLEAASLDEAMSEILRTLATELDWSLAVYWVATEEAPGARPVLLCRAIWAEEVILNAAVVEASRAAVLKPGDDPAGSAWAGREAVWIADLAADQAGLPGAPGLPSAPGARMRQAVAAGLRTVAAFPVRERDGVPAVIELYARDARPVEEGTLHLMTAIGNQVCLVMHRTEAQSAALEALEQSREELETVLRALPDGITVRDGAGRLVYANEAMARAVGLPDLRASPAEILGRFRIWDENGRPLSADEIPRAQLPANGEERILRYRPIGDDGGDRWVSLKAAPVAAARGGSARVVIVMRDITAARHDQEWQRFLGDASITLAASLDLPTALEELAALAARTVADRCAVVLRRNKSEPRNSEPRVVAFAGAMRADAADAASVDRARIECLRAAQAAIASRQPMLESTAAGSSVAVPLELRGEPIGALVLATLGEGRRYGPSDLGAVQELARRAAMAIDNVRLLAEAQESVRAREDLLAIVSHDLRNPLGVVLASSALLLKSSLPPEPPGKEGRARRQIEAIERAGNRMNRLIRDLLDFAAIQAGHLSVSSHPREVGTIVREVLDALEPLAAGKTIKLVDGSPENAALRLSCDHDRVIQLFSNVVGNAVKFTPEGGTVTLRAAPDGVMVRFAVADTGPGISPEELPYVFDRYYQARRRNRDGIGLGLSIARGIVEAHGGRIWVESPTALRKEDGGQSEGQLFEGQPKSQLKEGESKAESNPEFGPGGTTFFFTLPAPQQ